MHNYRGPHHGVTSSLLRRGSGVPDRSDWPQPLERETRDPDGIRTGKCAVTRKDVLCLQVCVDKFAARYVGLLRARVIINWPVVGHNGSRPKHLVLMIKVEENE